MKVRWFRNSNTKENNSQNTLLIAFLIPEDGFQTLTGQSIAIGPHDEVSTAPPSHATFVVMVIPKNSDVCSSNRIYRALGWFVFLTLAVEQFPQPFSLQSPHP